MTELDRILAERGEVLRLEEQMRTATARTLKMRRVMLWLALINLLTAVLNIATIVGLLR